MIKIKNDSKLINTPFYSFGNTNICYYYLLFTTLFRWLDDDMLNAITPKLLGNKPNTYTYTKQLAETLLRKEADDLPLCIVRPSIVTAAWQEPLPVSCLWV